jgi:hypothetical protein
LCLQKYGLQVRRSTEMPSKQAWVALIGQSLVGSGNPGEFVLQNPNLNVRFLSSLAESRTLSFGAQVVRLQVYPIGATAGGQEVGTRVQTNDADFLVLQTRLPASDSVITYNVRLGWEAVLAFEVEMIPAREEAR